MERLTARDALMYWISEKIPNDQFLLYAFDTAETDPNVLRRWVQERVELIGDLRLVVRDVPWDIDYPAWVSCEPDEDRIVVHDISDRTWQGWTDAIADLLGAAVDVRESPWRLHLFPGVARVPGGTADASLVAVLQVSHALADGKRAAAIARSLFGPEPPAVSPRPASRVESIAQSKEALVVRGILRLPVLFGRMVVSGVRAYRAYRDSEALTARGEIPPKLDGRDLTVLNSDPAGRHGVRLIVLPLSDLRGGSETVTIAALTAISVALPAYLERGGHGVPARLGAEVTVADSVDSPSRNNFRNVSVDLFPSERDLRVRARKIAEALDERRIRAAHPTVLAQGDPMAVTAAPLIRSGVRSYSSDVVPEKVSGNTVLTSVNRGPADLRFGAGDALFTAGFPALSPAMGVTHGVYSLGETVTVSVHFGPTVMPDADVYEDMLRRALSEVRDVLR
ncbi:hypothetical protein [Rhodococcus sp. NPDC058521]|uniref:hypothetical protein n=1 Tax=Rhodococcus sp. NPDC058521 TaxID=3346536 RepID=UPI003659102E